MNRLMQMGWAIVHVCVEGGAKYVSEAKGVHSGARFEFGETFLTNHKPEHISYEAAAKDADTPWGAFSGSVFVSSGGRPELIEPLANRSSGHFVNTGIVKISGEASKISRKPVGVGLGAFVQLEITAK